MPHPSSLFAFAPVSGAPVRAAVRGPARRGGAPFRRAARPGASRRRRAGYRPVHEHVLAGDVHPPMRGLDRRLRLGRARQRAARSAPHVLVQPRRRGRRRRNGAHHPGAASRSSSPPSSGLVAVLAVYVWKRNLALPPEQQVLTRAHFDYLARGIFERLHLKPSTGAAIQSRGGHEDTTTIELLRKDGTSLEKLTSSPQRLGGGRLDQGTRRERHPLARHGHPPRAQGERTPGPVPD